MRYAKSLTVVSLLIATGTLAAQQSSPLGPPTGAAAPVTFTPVVQQAPAPGPAPALGPLPTPTGPAPTPPAAIGPPLVYGPPSGFPPPPAPPPGPPLLLRDPARNPAIWGGVEALLWWSKNQPLPIPIVTTGPASQGMTAGNLGAPGTTSLDGPLHFGATGGLRVFAGAWLESSHTFGIDASVFFLGGQSARFSAVDRGGLGAFVINEPVAGAPFLTQVSAPGFDTGNVAVTAHSRLVGADANLLCNLYRGGGWTLNVLGGYRFLGLDESLNIAANSEMFVATTYTDGLGNVLVNAPAGSTIAVYDHFGTRNQFNGGQLGVGVQYLLNRWSFGGTFKLALGDVHQVATIDGVTTVYPVNGSSVPLSGGNYATLQTGRYTQDRFAVSPDLQLNVGYQLTPWLRATVGYQFLYLSNVLRPGNQIDNTYDGVNHPLVPMVSSGYRAQGLNFGLQFSY